MKKVKPIIFKEIIEQNGISQSELANKLEIDKAVISRFLKKYSPDYIVKYKDNTKTLLKLNDNFAHGLSFEIDQNKLFYCLISASGQVIEESLLIQLDNINSYHIYRSMKKIYHKLKKDYPKISFITIISHSLVLKDNSIQLPNKDFLQEKDIRNILNLTDDFIIIIENFANVGALAEKRYNYPIIDSLLLLKLNKGVGAGLIMNNKIYSGSDGASLEISRMRVKPNSKQTYNQFLDIYEYLVKENYQNINEFKEKIENEEQKALEILERYLDDFCLVLGNINYVLNPEMIVISHPLFEEMDELFFLLTSQLAEYEISKDKIKISSLSFRNYSCVLASVYLEKYFQISIENFSKNM